MHGFDVKTILSSATAALASSAVMLALFGAGRIDRLRARDEAVKAANADLLALASEIERFADAIQTYTEELARWRGITLVEGVLSAPALARQVGLVLVHVVFRWKIACAQEALTR